MAMIDTGRLSDWIDRVPELIQKLRATIIEELDAANTYDRFINCVRRMGIAPMDEQGKPREIPDDKLSIAEAEEIVGVLTIIRDDEVSHSAALIEIMRELDSGINKIMAKGIDGA